MAREEARERGTRIYLVGGVVRDLLLGAPIRDVDLAVAGDAIAFTRGLSARLGASPRLHGRFGTAALRLPDGKTLDLAGTRRETYAHPGALPKVVAAESIEEDLARRDFTIHAMALELHPGRRLVDPFSGRRDLARGEIRELHSASFLDDPTRAFRAVRYANRLRFRIPGPTRRRISAALEAGAFERISGDRVRRELRRIFEEPRRADALRLLQAVGLGTAIDASLVADVRAVAIVRAAEELARRHASGTTWLCYLLCWMWSSDEGAVSRVMDRLALTGLERKTARGWPQTRERLAAGPSAATASAWSRTTRGLQPDEVVAAAAGLRAGVARRGLLRHGLRPGLSLRIRGADLRAAGVAPGPAIGRALAATLAARQDGRIGASEELEFALRAASEEPA